MSRVLFLDEMPRSAAETVWTGAKIFLKEGVLHGDWRAVFRNRSVGGSKVLPTAMFEGLRRLGRNVERNRFDGADTYDVAWVYKDPRALRWALEQKQAGRIGKIVTGPMVVNLPHEADRMILDPGVDAWLFYSGWIRDVFHAESAEVRPSYVSFAGVDASFWHADRSEASEVLMYRKTVENDVYPATMAALEARGLSVTEIKYGNYTPEGFRAALARARAAVFISRTETQGLAMFEAWSMGVPTLHWDSGVMRYHGRALEGASSCPYLTSACGRRFAALDTLEVELDALLAEAPRLDPRAVVLSRFTLDRAASRASQVLDAVTDGRELPDPS